MCNMVNIWEKKPGRKSELLLEPLMKVSGYTHPDLPVTFDPLEEELSWASWGLIPGWVKTEAEAELMRKRTLNARSETIWEKPAYRDAAHHRCLIWINGFYEWQHLGKAKKPFFLHTGEPLMALGGLISEWTNPVSGALLTTCTVVTTEANELMRKVHNSKERMPLILQPQQWAAWLDTTASEEAINRVARPLPDGILIAEDLTPPVDEVDEKGQMRMF